MEAPRDVLAELQAWFVAHCNDEWEHSDGVSITSLDNPGWSIEIQLGETEVATRSFPRREAHRSSEDWIVCWQDETIFRGACGPLNLAERRPRKS
jgi:hypothetical protein